MNILWHSNSPSSGSGYGNQTALFTPRLKQDGHQVVISAFYGIEGSPTVDANGILTLPRGADTYGTDALDGHMHRGHWNGQAGEVIISLIDPFVLPARLMHKHYWAAWTPVDSVPVFEGNVQSLRAARWIWSMSRFGHEQLQAAGFNPIYVPHGVDTQFYTPGDQDEARAALGRYLNVDLTGKYLVTTVAANKGTPSRKNFTGMIEAFALFKNGNDALGIPAHPDAIFYLHTESTGVWHGENLHAIARAFGVADAVLFPGQYDVVTGMLTPAFLRQVYRAADIFYLLSSEGFGIPTVEAQSCALPVIVADFAASSELCFGGWAVPGLRRYIGASNVFWHDVVAPLAARALCEAYTHRTDFDLRMKARAGAVAYDVDRVWVEYMRPALKRMSRDLIIGQTRPYVAEVAHV